MGSRMITVRGVVTLVSVGVVALSLSSKVARGDEDGSRIRWDIQHYPNLVLQPGGQAFADAVDGSRIKLTGSGTFKTNGHDPIGGGTWQTLAPTGALTGSGTYRVL